METNTVDDKPVCSLSKEWSSVIEFNDDVLMAILIRLPPKSLFKCRFVSKRWNAIITTSYFLNTYQARTSRIHQPRLLAFIQTTPILSQKTRPSPLMNILPLLPNHDIDTDAIHHFGFEYGFFIASSNGLVLTGFHIKKAYYVLNLLTRGCVSIPPPPKFYPTPSMALVYDEREPGLVPNYYILSLQYEFSANSTDVQIYTSKTRTWTRSKLTGAENFRVTTSKPPIAINGVLHCYSISPWALVVLDTKELIVDGGENNVQLIMLPDSETRFGGNFAFDRSSDDQLLFGTINYTYMKFWSLPKSNHASSEWILVETISLDSMRKGITPLLLNMIPSPEAAHKRKLVLKSMPSGYFRLEGFISMNNNTFAILRFNFMGRESNLYKIIFLYNLQKKTFELVRYAGGMCNSISDVSRGSCYGWYPYMEPLTLSSYGSLS